MPADAVLQEAVRRIRDQFAPTHILLFGSRATGTAQADSDYDLLVVLPSGATWRTAGLIRAALLGLPAAFDIFVHNEADWQRWRLVGPTFEHHIAATGVELAHAA